LEFFEKSSKGILITHSAGGDCEINCLPDIGVKGNTHFLMANFNNQEVADVMGNWLKSKGLAK